MVSVVKTVMSRAILNFSKKDYDRISAYAEYVAYHIVDDYLVFEVGIYYEPSFMETFNEIYDRYGKQFKLSREDQKDWYVNPTDRWVQWCAIIDSPGTMIRIDSMSELKPSRVPLKIDTAFHDIIINVESNT